MNSAQRTAHIRADRLTGWLDRFAASHRGLASTTDTDDGALLTMRDGATALLSAPWPDDGRPGHGADLLERLVSVALQERRIGILLARRGGFAVGVAAGGNLVAHKVGSASARSRGGDAGAAVAERAAQEAARIFDASTFEYLATGGDKLLVESALAASALRRYTTLPRLAPLAVVDPKMDVLTRAATDFCSIHIRITDAPA